ncbi:hypothetical protein [Segetibacter aerophilus]|uniref:Lipoprotein n=1 Tax=Segetibacter aerophilus TaxID=670293 RepID=A0A512B9P2_9BACT|nr:hypothetical protein [Segetibacter aerophilus]GEO08537.1 hypothetical protein SAE01_10330 [Segetibacter aerophilus]
MRYKILLYGLMAAVITSCSSAYKASQTPDDVYYSPAREGVQKKTVNRDRYEDYVASEDDQYLRMKIRNRDRWAGIDDYTYWNDSRYVPSYNYNYDYYRNNVYNSYVWNNWYSPYSTFYHPYINGSFGYYNRYNNIGLYYPQYGYNSYGSSYISKNPARVISPSVSRPNLNGYRNGLYNNSNSNTNRSNQGVGNTLKRVFSANENARSYSNENNTNTYSAPQRTYTPSSSSSSSSSSSGSSSSGSSSGGGVSRPPR